MAYQTDYFPQNTQKLVAGHDLEGGSSPIGGQEKSQCARQEHISINTTIHLPCLLMHNLHVSVLVFQKEISFYDLLLAITLLVIVNSMNY